MAGSANEPWEIYDASLPFAGCIYSPQKPQRSRMAAIGIGGGDLLVVSPGVPMSDAGWEQLSRLGTPRFLLAPNHFHNAGIAAWKARFPGATAVAHPRALPRLRKKVPGVAIEDLAVLEKALPEGIRVFSPPMAKQGEVLVSVKTQEGAAWFVTDALMNEQRLSGVVGLLMRALGFRTGLITNPFFKRIFLADKAAYKEWILAEIDRDAPVLFVPSHGAPIRGVDVADRLRAATAAA